MICSKNDLFFCGHMYVNRLVYIVIQSSFCIILEMELSRYMIGLMNT